MYRNINSVLLVFGAALLVGCGGGGDSGPDTSKLVTITTSNYSDIATDAVVGVNGASDIADLAGTLVGSQISQSRSYGLKGLAYTTAMTAVGNWGVFSNPTIVGAVTQRSVDCSGGGTVSGSVSDADDSQTPTAGDSASLTFVNCQQDGLLVNGSASIAINSFSGDFSSSGSGSLAMTFNNLTAGSEALNGSLTLSFNRSSATSASMTLTMPSLTVTSPGNTWIYTSLSMTASDTGSSGTFEMAGNVYSSLYDGSIQISTPTTLTIDSLNSVSGSILMQGNNGTKVRIIGQGTTSILVQADTTGNGTYDTSKTVTLASFGL